MTDVFTFPDRASDSSNSKLPKFVYGEENWLLRSVLDRVRFAEQELDRRKIAFPLVLWGAAGVGKSLVLHALAEQLESTIVPDSRRSEPNPLVTSAKDWHVEARQQRHANTDVRSLLLDDLHQLAGQPTAQRRVVAEIDRVMEIGGVIVAVSRSHPGVTAGLGKRLVSRLLQGTTVEIEPPGLASRTSIIQNLAFESGWRLTPGAAHFAAENMVGTVRDIRRKIHRSLPVRPIDDRLVGKDEIQSLLDTNLQDPRSLRKWLGVVAKEFGVTQTAMRSKSRRQNVVLARSLAMLLFRRQTNLSLKAIGELFGGRDHTTVMHACKKINEQLPKDPKLKSQYERLLVEFEKDN